MHAAQVSSLPTGALTADSAPTEALKEARSRTARLLVRINMVLDVYKLLNGKIFYVCLAFVVQAREVVLMSPDKETSI